MLGSLDFTGSAHSTIVIFLREQLFTYMLSLLDKRVFAILCEATLTGVEVVGRQLNTDRASKN